MGKEKRERAVEREDSLNHRVDPQAEQVLVVVSLNAWSDERTELVDLFTRGRGVSVEDAGELDAEFGGAVLLKRPCECIFIVGNRT